MKKNTIILLCLILPGMLLAQLKSQAKLPVISQAIAKPSTSILSFLNSDKVTMHHSISMNYATFAGQSIMTNAYQNTIDVKLSNPLQLRVNLGVMNSPYNSFNNPALNNARFFGGAELNYRPTENTSLHLGFNIAPGYYGYNPYRSNYFWDY